MQVSAEVVTMTEGTWIPLLAGRSLRYLTSLYVFILGLSKCIENNAGMYHSFFKNTACVFFWVCMKDFLNCQISQELMFALTRTKRGCSSGKHMFHMLLYFLVHR